MSAKIQTFIVKGMIKKGAKNGFTLEISARSEKHAAALARSIIGGRHRLRSTALAIQEVKKK